MGKNKTAAFPFLHLSSRSFLSFPSLSLFVCVGLALSLSFSSDRRLLGRRENPTPTPSPQRFSQHGLSLFTPRHYQQWTSCKQHLLLLALYEKKKPTIWITPTMKRWRQWRRPSGGRRLKVVHHPSDAISVARYIKQAPSLILNPIG